MWVSRPPSQSTRMENSIKPDEQFCSGSRSSQANSQFREPYNGVFARDTNSQNLGGGFWFGSREAARCINAAAAPLFAGALPSAARLRRSSSGRYLAEINPQEKKKKKNSPSSAEAMNFDVSLCVADKREVGSGEQG